MTSKKDSHHRITRLSVSGGFLAGVTLDLADGLNCFIGGRGAGKTTALEFLRYGLGLMPDPRSNAARSRTLESLVKSNLAAGRIQVDIETKAGMTYVAGRGFGETVQVINEQGTAVPVSLDRDRLFSADVFSQNEIEDIATDPAAQLELLDRFEEDDSLRIAGELSRIQKLLGTSSEQLRAIDAEIEDLIAVASELPIVEERLRTLAVTHSSDAAALNAAHQAKGLRIAESQYISQVLTSAEKAARAMSETVSAFDAAAGEQLTGDMRDGANGALLTTLESERTSFRDALDSARRAVSSALERLRTKVADTQQQLLEQHAQQEAEYRSLMDKHQEEGGRAAARAHAQESLARAQTALREKEARQKQRASLRAYRSDLMRQLSELRDQRFVLRKRVGERLSRQFRSLRITVTQGSDVSEYREMLAAALKGVGLRQGVAADRLAETMLPIELAQLVRANDTGRLATQTGLDHDRARKIVDALSRDGTAYDLESVELGDSPCIELRDGETFKESTHLSTGQRCTTVLPILLVQSERPLLIDQPEDNLDNAFVFDTIVAALQEVRGSRQVIFVTHNPNIPVLGEAERVFVFISDGERAMLSNVGTVDECKADIERILEGGREAFRKRKERYGH